MRRHAPPSPQRPRQKPWFWFGPRLEIGSGPLAGSGWSDAEATGDLEMSVLVESTAGVVATAAGDVQVSILVAGTAQSVATAHGELGGDFLMVDLAGTAQGQATATGDATLSGLIGDAKDVATAHGALSSATPLAGAAAGQATAEGAATDSTPLAGSAADVATAAGTISKTTAVAGAAADVATATGATTLTTSVTGAAAAAATAHGATAVSTGVAGAATDVVTATGAAGVGISLDAVAHAAGSATGNLTTATSLAGAASAEAAATGGLGVALTITGGVTYAVNVKTGAVTTLLNFDFERLVTAHGKLYGLKGGTLYRVGGDTDPASTAIPATLRFAPQSFGTNLKKRLNKIYLPARLPGDLTTTPIYDEVEGWQYASEGYDENGLVTHKVHVGRGNEFHTLGLVIANHLGGRLDVGGLELHINALSRRI